MNCNKQEQITTELQRFTTNGGQYIVIRGGDMTVFNMFKTFVAPLRTYDAQRILPNQNELQLTC